MKIVILSNRDKELYKINNVESFIAIDNDGKLNTSVTDFDELLSIAQCIISNALINSSKAYYDRDNGINDYDDNQFFLDQRNKMVCKSILDELLADMYDTTSQQLDEKFMEVGIEKYGTYVDYEKLRELEEQGKIKELKKTMDELINSEEFKIIMTKILKKLTHLVDSGRISCKDLFSLMNPMDETNGDSFGKFLNLFENNDDEEED